MPYIFCACACMEMWYTDFLFCYFFVLYSGAFESFGGFVEFWVEVQHTGR